MQPRKVLGGEAAHLDDRRGDRIPDRLRREHAGHRRRLERAAFALH